MTGFVQSDPLGEYRWADVADPFRHLAETVWAYGGRDLTLSEQLLAPHWKICVGIERVWASDARRPADCRSVLLGPVKTPRRNVNPAGYELIAVRLNPETASRVIGLSPKDIIDTDLRSLDLPVCRQALRLGEAGAPAEAVAGALLRAVLSQDLPPARAPDLAAARIRSANGQVNLARLAADLGLSLRTLRRFFEAEFGISPKTYCRTVRLKSLLLHADRIEAPRWSELALQFGYADQSHMCTDLLQLTGSSPARLHSARRSAPG